MAEYKIECEQFLGFSHSGSVTTSGESTIELSDEEVATLVQLIREKGTTDVGELGLETSHQSFMRNSTKPTTTWPAMPSICIGCGKVLIMATTSMMKKN
jgi:hypothetical protein